MEKWTDGCKAYIPTSCGMGVIRTQFTVLEVVTGSSRCGICNFFYVVVVIVSAVVVVVLVVVIRFRLG